MSQPRDDWDAEERAALEGLEGELDEIRRRHADDPSLGMLFAADADALPPELQERVARHLQDSAWSRALVEGLRETRAGAELDPESEQRLFDRITHDARAASPRRRWKPAVVVGGLALAATLLLAVVLPRSGPDPRPVADTSATPRDGDQAGSGRGGSPPSAAPVSIAFDKPEVKLSPSALTWRGNAPESPFLRDLAPAFDAYRAGEYARASEIFDRLAPVYPDAIEVRFYQGVSRMLAGDHAGAIPPLEAAAALRSATFADDVSWFLAVAQQRVGRPEAHQRFVELCRGSSSHAAAACAAATQLGAIPTSPRQP